MGKIQGEIPVILFKEGNKFVAYSPAIDLSTCGDTEEQARARFDEAAKIFFHEIVRTGTVNEVLTECGWRKLKITQTDTWAPPIYKTESMKIPEGVN